MAKIMNTKHKMATAGAGMVAAGIGLGLAGVCLMAPAVVVWSADIAEGVADRLFTRLEGASRKAGTLVGTLQRSFGEASEALANGGASPRNGGAKS
jgi:hypothetical protein